VAAASQKPQNTFVPYNIQLLDNRRMAIEILSISLRKIWKSKNYCIRTGQNFCFESHDFKNANSFH